MIQRSVVLIFLVGLLSSGPAYSQTILTALDRFNLVSQHYQSFQDYTATIHITQEEGDMEGELFFLAPDRLRIDFSSPTDQVIVYNGEKILVYIPRYNVILSDDMLGNRLEEGLSAAGLELMKQKYSIAYLSGPTPVALEEGSEESVVGFRLIWRTQNEGFRELHMFVDPATNYIRRIVGITATYQTITMDLYDMTVNQNIPVTLFDYDPPGSANLFEGFLYQNTN